VIKIELLNKKYQIIYADPPWDIKYIKETKNGINTYDLPYPIMTDSEIINLPIKKIVDNDAILFLWVIDSKIPIIKELMESWGFEYVTVGFVWNKKSKTTKGVNAILSKYTRKSCEFCYIGKRGKYIVDNPCRVSQIINECKKEHSHKPDCIRQYIVQMVGDKPKIELFARQRYDGWDCYGNELSKTIQKFLS
jgi:site-specific DNA-methyltransferase (adenine-specific)